MHIKLCFVFFFNYNDFFLKFSLVNLISLSGPSFIGFFVIMKGARKAANRVDVLLSSSFFKAVQLSDIS